MSISIKGRRVYKGVQLILRGGRMPRVIALWENVDVCVAGNGYSSDSKFKNCTQMMLSDGEEGCWDDAGVHTAKGTYCSYNPIQDLDIVGVLYS